MITAYGVYSIYNPSKLHFTTAYDIFKYENRSKSVSIELLEKRKDKGEFERWASILKTKERTTGVCVANFSQLNDNWLYEPKESALEIYQEWKKTRSLITQIFKDDIILLSSYMEGEGAKVSNWSEFIYKTKGNNKPPLLQLCCANKLSRESICILDNITGGFIDNWAELFSIDPLLNQLIFRLKKYQPFCVKLCPTASDIFNEFITKNER